MPTFYVIRLAVRVVLSMLTDGSRPMGRSWAGECLCRFIRGLLDDAVDQQPQWLRTQLAAPGMSPPADKGVQFKTAEIAGVSCLIGRHRDNSKPPQRILVYLHGGGYVIGTARQYRSLLSALCLGSDALVIAPDYPLSPEHPYPEPQLKTTALIESLLKDTDALLQSFSHSDVRLDELPVILAGDSAGGGLVLSAMLALGRDQSSADKGERVKGLVLISPWVAPDYYNREFSADSANENRTVSDYLYPGILEHWLNHHLRQQSESDLQSGLKTLWPAIDFMTEDLSGLPPCYVQYGDAELMTDQIKVFCERVGQFGVPIEADAFAGQFHEFQVFYGWLNESAAAVNQLNNKIVKMAN